MSDIAKTLEEKRRQLQTLRESRSSANCAREHSSQADVRREMEVVALEDEVKELERQLSERA